MKKWIEYLKKHVRQFKMKRMLHEMRQKKAVIQKILFTPLPDDEHRTFLVKIHGSTVHITDLEI